MIPDLNRFCYWLGRTLADPGVGTALFHTCRNTRPGGKRGFYGNTRKDTLLESVPLGVTTSIFPLVAPEGTLVVISEAETTSKAAAVPLKLTLVAPVRPVPRTLISAPTAAESGRVSTNGPNPTERLKTVPHPGPA
jgi:hypothetical protein